MANWSKSKPNAQFAAATSTASVVPIDDIVYGVNIRHVNPDDPSLKELAESIRKVGVLEPVLINNVGEYEEKVLISGHRRVLASEIAGLKTIPANIYEDLSAQQVLEIQASENLQRVNLTPVEEAELYVRMRDTFEITVDDVAARVGRSPGHVYRYIRLLALPKEVLAGIDNETISLTKAIALSSLPEKLINSLVSGRDKWMLQKPVKEMITEVRRFYMHDFSDGDIGFDRTITYRDKDDNKDYPPCDACPSRSQLELFDDLYPVSVCPDIECYRAKSWIADDLAREAAEKAEKAAKQEDAEECDEDDSTGENPRRDFLPDDDDNESDEDEDDDDDPMWKQRQAEHEEEVRQGMKKSRDAAEYYLDIIRDRGFQPQTYFTYSTGAELVNKKYCYNTYQKERAVQYDDLLVKYLGKNLKQLEAEGTAEEILIADIIWYVFDSAGCGSDGDYGDLDEWLNCEPYSEPEGEVEGEGEVNDSEGV